VVAGSFVVQVMTADPFPGAAETAEITGGTVSPPPIVTVAVPYFVGSATLVALTVIAPEALAGAVKSPPEVIVPAEADHVTAPFVVPDTVALNCCFCPGASTTEAGVTETLIDWAGATCNCTVLDVPLSAAPTVTTCGELQLLTLTWKFALVALLGTVTVDGADTVAFTDDVLMLTGAPPAGAAPDSDTAHAAEAGTTSDVGLHVRLARLGVGALPVMLILPPVAVTDIAVPSGAAANAFVNWTDALWVEADEDTVSLTVATVPLCILFRLLSPVSRQVYEPVPGTQSKLLPAPDAAVPTDTLMPLKTDAG